MDRDIVEDRLSELLDLSETLRLKKIALREEFFKEFPIRRAVKDGSGIRMPKGYMISYSNCRQTRCPDCPHTLTWTWFERQEKMKKPKYEGKKLKKLPKSFWNSKRKKETLDRFRYYEDTLQKLNKDHKDVKDTIAAISKKALYCLRRLK